MSAHRLLRCGIVAGGWLLLAVAPLASVLADPAATADDAPAEQADAPVDPVDADFATLVGECLDLVLKHHIDPPTRQEMLLGGARAMHGEEVPLGLARTVSTLATAEQTVKYLDELALHVGAGPDATADARRAAVLRFLAGALAVSRDGSRVESPLAFGRNKSIRENRYVGIGIALAAENGWPKMARVFPNGPAHKAGIPDGSLIMAVDGQSTAGKTLEEVVVMLTGPKGSAVELLVRRPGAADTQPTRLVRDVIPFRTVVGVGGHSHSAGDFTLEAAPEIGYASITSIGPSTTHELRELERTLIADGCRALIVDLRSAHQARLHDGVILADALLNSGVMGRSKDAVGERVYEAQPDELFAGWPVAVLVDVGTQGVAEWVAAAWQDRQRAIVVGDATSGIAWCMTGVELPAGLGAVELRTDVLLRGDGRKLLGPGQEFVGGDEVEMIERRMRRHRTGLTGSASGGSDESELDDPQPWGVTPDRQLRHSPRGGPAVYVAPVAPNANGQSPVAPGLVTPTQAATAIHEDPVAVAAGMLRGKLRAEANPP